MTKYKFKKGDKVAAKANLGDILTAGKIYTVISSTGSSDNDSVMIEEDDRGWKCISLFYRRFKLVEESMSKSVTKTKFIPGKKYSRSTDMTRVHLFVGYSSRGMRVWENNHGTIWQEMDSIPWKEFKEPVIHTKYVHWYRVPKTGKIGTLVSTHPEFSGPYEHLKTQKVEYKEEF